MLAVFALSTGFAAPGRFANVGHSRTCVDMTAKAKVSSNFQVTEALQSYCDQKLSKPLDTFGWLLTGEPELHLKVESRGVHDADHKGKEAHIAEITAFCLDKHVINAKSENEDMYASLDELTDTLTRSLRKYKEKRSDVREGRKREAKSELEEGILADAEE